MPPTKLYDPSVERAFNEEEIVNLCTCCTLGTAMMDCPNCPFKLGKAVRAVHLTSLELDVVAKEAFWATLPKWLWDAYFTYLNKMQDNTWGVSGRNALTRAYAQA